MDIVVTGRHLTVSDRFRAHIEEKLEKITQLEPRTRRVEVLVSHEPNRRQAEVCDKVEITCYAKGPVVRAEACVEVLCDGGLFFCRRYAKDEGANVLYIDSLEG